MIEFKDKFIADGLDVLQDIEEALLNTDEAIGEPETVQVVFRGLHTLKGAAGMYGFKNIEHLMHLIESVYDALRANELTLRKGIIDLTLEVVDHVTVVLRSDENDYPRLELRTKKLENEISALLDIKDDVKQIERAAHQSGKTHSYFVTFIEDSDFTVRGIQVKSILKSLEDIGTVISRSILNKDNSLYWEIIAVSDAPNQDFEDNFMFIDDICCIKVIAVDNILRADAISNYIKTCTIKGVPIDFDQLQTHYSDHINTSRATREHENLEAKLKNVYLKVASEKIDEQMNLLSELVTAKAELKLISDREKYKKISKVVETIDKITGRFRKNILNIRLIPVKSLYVTLLRLVRDISAQLGKDIQFTAEGMETELDKGIIDSLETPLTHLIRNSIDHGIESADEREKKGKPRKGTICMKAYYSASHVFIEIIDDGSGIDKQKVYRKAVEKKIITPETQLSEKEIFELIFMPGFSTAQNLSEVSGRGVGMDIVKKNIDLLRGEITVQSTEGVGTSIIIKLPLTLSIIDTMLVQSGERFFSVPLNVISHCAQLNHNELNETVNEQIEINRQILPYIHLRQIFKIEGEYPEKEKVVVIQNSNTQVGLIVDKVIGEHQAVIKPLGDFFADKQYFSGVSILADGHLSVILDTNKLIQDKVYQNHKHITYDNTK